MSCVTWALPPADVEESGVFSALLASLLTAPAASPGGHRAISSVAGRGEVLLPGAHTGHWGAGGTGPRRCSNSPPTYRGCVTGQE